MTTADYGTTLALDTPFEEAVPRVRAALATQGFGVLTEIDVRATLKAKLDADMEPYLILGACNPPLAHRAREADRSIGMLLPCNVVVRARPEGGTLVQALDPGTMVELTALPELRPVATRPAAALPQPWTPCTDHPAGALAVPTPPDRNGRFSMGRFARTCPRKFS